MTVRGCLNFRALFLFVVVAVALGLFVDRVGVLFKNPYQAAVRGWDQSFYYFWLRSFVIDHDFDFRNDCELSNTLDEKNRELVLESTPTAVGLLPNKYPIAWALSGLPWFYLGHVVTKVAHIFGSSWPEDGYSPWYQFFTLLGQFVYAVLSVWLAFRICSYFIPKPSTFYGVLLMWLGSFLVYYQTVNLAMSHSIVFFCMTACYACALQMREQPRRLRYWLGVGFFGGLMVLSRFQSGIYLIYPFVIALCNLRQDRFYLKHLILAGLAFFLTLLPQFIAWKIVYGSYFLNTYEGEGFNWLHPQILNILFSFKDGLFYWHPAFLLGFIGLAAFCVHHKKIEGWTWPLMVLLMLYVNACWWDWTFASPYGAREFENTTLFAMIGTSFLLVQKNKWITVSAYVLLAIFAVWNVQFIYFLRKSPIHPINVQFTYDVSYQNLIKICLQFWKQRLF